MSGQLACYCTGIGARWGPFAKICTVPTPRYGQLAKICTGNLTGSRLRKYAHRQNHTIHGILRFYPPKSKTKRATTRPTKTSEDYAGWRLRRGAGVAGASQRRRYDVYLLALLEPPSRALAALSSQLCTAVALCECHHPLGNGFCRVRLSLSDGRRPKFNGVLCSRILSLTRSNTVSGIGGGV